MPVHAVGYWKVQILVFQQGSAYLHASVQVRTAARD